MIRSQIKEVQNGDIKQLFDRVQLKWEKVYPGLKLIVVIDGDGRAYRFTWGVNSEHIQEAYGSWQAVDSNEKSLYLTDMFKFKIEKMEHEFEHYAIKHFLR